MRDLPPNFASLLDAQVVAPAFFLHLDWPDSPVYWVTAYGPINWDGKTWAPTGEFMQIAQIGESSDGRANGVQLTLSGIPAATLVHIFRNDFQGRKAQLYIGFFNDTGGLITEPLLPPRARRSPTRAAHAHPRHEDWPEALAAYLATHATRPFDWAAWNCCHFARAWVQQITGVDLDRGWLAQCTGLLTAQHLLARKGGVAGLFARACHRYGFSQVHRYYASRGDLVLFKGEGGFTAIGICCGESFAAVGPSGLEYRDMREATHAFKIG